MFFSTTKEQLIRRRCRVIFRLSKSVQKIHMKRGRRRNNRRLFSPNMFTTSSTICWVFFGLFPSFSSFIVQRLSNWIILSIRAIQDSLEFKTRLSCSRKLTLKFESNKKIAEIMSGCGEWSGVDSSRVQKRAQLRLQIALNSKTKIV
jgi:hypothetical protein